MNILICFLPALLKEDKFEVWSMPPLALYVLESVAAKDGHQVVTVDPSELMQYNGKKNLPQLCADYIEEKLDKIDAVAFSSNTFNWGVTKYVINAIAEKFPELPIIVGGLHATIFKDYVFEAAKIDYVLRGEGEKTFPMLLDAIENNKDMHLIPNLSFKENGVIIHNPDDDCLTIEELEATPPVNYDNMFSTNYYKSYPVESSRGCAFSCVFCSIPHRHNWRGLSVDTVVNRVDSLISRAEEKNVEICEVDFVDDCFTINIERATEIIKKLVEKYGFKYRYFFEVRISNIINSKLMYSIPSEVAHMQIGVECGYDEGLKLVKKGITVKQLFQALEILHVNGMRNRTALSFIIGFPWESEKEINATLDTVERIIKVYKMYCAVNWLLLLPSDLWKQRKEYGIDVEEDIYDDPLWLNDEELFFKVHPKLNEEMLDRINVRLNNLKELTKMAGYSKPFTNDAD